MPRRLAVLEPSRSVEAPSESSAGPDADARAELAMMEVSRNHIRAGHGKSRCSVDRGKMTVSSKKDRRDCISTGKLRAELGGKERETTTNLRARHRLQQ